MMRATSTLLLRRTGVISLSIAATASKPVRAVIGPNGAVPEVAFPSAGCPLAATVETIDGRTVLVAEVVKHMNTVLARACAAQNTDRGVVSALSLGFKARILAVKSGMDRAVLINPVLKLTSHQKIHSWTEHGDEMFRVARHRSVAVKYTTVDGDEETWYAMPLEESEAVQRHLDQFDGFSAGDRVAPLCAASTAIGEAHHAAASLAAHGVVSRTVFREHEGPLMQLVEKVPRSILAEAA